MSARQYGRDVAVLLGALVAVVLLGHLADTTHLVNHQQPVKPVAKWVVFAAGGAGIALLVAVGIAYEALAERNERRRTGHAAHPSRPRQEGPVTTAHIALGFLAAFALASVAAVVEQIADWLADHRTPPAEPVDLRAVQNDDQLLDRISTGEPPWFNDEPTTVQLKVWRDEIELGLDDHVRRALWSGQQ